VRGNEITITAPPPDAPGDLVALIALGHGMVSQPLTWADAVGAQPRNAHRRRATTPEDVLK
jgi:hypothetical protein